MKTRILVGLSVLFFAVAVSCSPKLNTEAAGEVVKTTFNLTEKDQVEVLGVAKEAGDVMLVKFKINGTEVYSKMRKYDKGWQLDEVQNRLGGWIPTATIQDQFDPTEKMKIVKVDISLIGIVLSRYLLDHAKFSFENEEWLSKESDVYNALCPLYAESLPTSDPWGNPYWVLFGKYFDESLYGIPKGAADDFMIFSAGRDGKIENWVYDPKNDIAGLYKGIDPDRDIVYLNGSFIRAPESWDFAKIIAATKKK
jgi:hypothetical protein